MVSSPPCGDQDRDTSLPRQHKPETGYAAGGTPLAAMQEDFPVHIHVLPL